jgi:hypothetical protein
MGDVSKVEQKIWVLLDSTITSFSATLKAGPVADQPTSLSSRLLPQFGKDLFDSVTKTRQAALLSARP